MHTTKKNTVALVDGDRDLCRRMQTTLRGGEFHLSAVCHSHGEAIGSIDWNLIDILLCSDTDPEGHVLKFVRRAKAENSSLLAVYLVDEHREGILERGIEAGVQGFLLRQDLDEALLFWLRSLLRGGVAIHPFIARSVIPDLAVSRRSKEEPLLTHRELQILAMLGEGGLYKQIADDLGISVHTVHNHAKRIYGKLGVAGRSEALRVAVESPIVRQLARLRRSTSIHGV